MEIISHHAHDHRHRHSDPERGKGAAEKGGQSLGRLISDLLAQALRARKTGIGKSATPAWVSKPMGARVDLGDKEAVYAAMEQPPAADGKVRP